MAITHYINLPRIQYSHQNNIKEITFYIHFMCDSYQEYDTATLT